MEAGSSRTKMMVARKRQCPGDTFVKYFGGKSDRPTSLIPLLSANPLVHYTLAILIFFGSQNELNLF